MKMMIGLILGATSTSFSKVEGDKIILKLLLKLIFFHEY